MADVERSVTIHVEKALVDRVKELEAENHRLKSALDEKHGGFVLEVNPLFETTVENAVKHDLPPHCPQAFLEAVRRAFAVERGNEGLHQATDDLMEETLIALGYGEGIAAIRSTTRWYA
jgi:hypothetical protein